jgi:hypothetical protein
LKNEEVGTARDDVRVTHDDVRVTPDEVRVTHELVSDMARPFEALELQSNSSALSAAGMEDCGMHGSRSLPSKELLMLGPEKLSCVASVKRAVLDCEVGGVAAAVGVQGMGGVGMTTACLVVASDQGVASAYPETRIWISLRTDVTAEAVVDQLAGIVEKAGGALTAKLMRDMFKEHGMVKLDSVTDNVRQWLHDRHVLFVLDNMFPASNESSSRHWAQFLKHILGCDSCLFFFYARRRVDRLKPRCDHLPAISKLAETERHVVCASRNIGGRPGAKTSPEIAGLSRGLPMVLATASPLACRWKLDWPRIE